MEGVKRDKYVRGSFDPDIGSWVMSSLNKMSLILVDSDFINQDLGSWDVYRVKNMTAIFYNAESFNQELGSMGGSVWIIIFASNRWCVFACRVISFLSLVIESFLIPK
jgi:Mycoplasma protein of unknown function, DUF285